MSNYTKQAKQILETKTCKGIKCHYCFCDSYCGELRKTYPGLTTPTWMELCIIYAKKYFREDKLKRIING